MQFLARRRSAAQNDDDARVVCFRREDTRGWRYRSRPASQR
jgi:hypothetical protein